MKSTFERRYAEGTCNRPASHSDKASASPPASAVWRCAISACNQRQRMPMIAGIGRSSASASIWRYRPDGRASVAARPSPALRRDSGLRRSQRAKAIRWDAGVSQRPWLFCYSRRRQSRSANRQLYEGAMLLRDQTVVVSRSRCRVTGVAIAYVAVIVPAPLSSHAPSTARPAIDGVTRPGRRWTLEATSDFLLHRKPPAPLVWVALFGAATPRCWSKTGRGTTCMNWAIETPIAARKRPKL